MSEPADGDKAKAEAVPMEAEIPPTRQHTVPEATGGSSQMQLHAAVTFPDDGTFAASVRKADNLLGLVEQGFLFALLATVVLVAASAALSDKILRHPFERWWFTIVRDGVFTMAMIGAVFATHQQRHLAMDLVSRRLSPRGRLILGLVLKLFTIAVVALLLRSGMHLHDQEHGHADDIISDRAIVTAIAIGAGLIMLHSLLHLLIDVEYLVRGKLPPERARSGH